MAGRQYQQVAYGLTSPLIAENPSPVVAKRDPTVSDFALPTTIWTNTATNTVFILASISNNQANWITVEAAGGAGNFASLTVTPGPISLTGTTTINTGGAATTTIGTGGTGAVNIGNATGNTAVTGTLTATGNITSSAGQINTTNGAIGAGNTAVSNAPAQFQTLKSRAGAAIVSGDGIGNLVFAAFDGTQFTTGAAITSTSSGTIANTRVAGNLNFLTHADAPAAGPVSRMTINSAGNVVVNAPDSGIGLSVNSGITAATGSIVLNQAGQKFQFSNLVGIYSGTGDPNTVVNAAQGSLYLRTDGSGVGNRAYINTDGVTAWTAITTVS